MPIKSSQPKWKKFRCPPLSAKRVQQIAQEANLACDELLRFSAGEVFGSDTGDDTRDGSGGSNSSSDFVPEELKWEFAEQVDSIRVEKVRVRSESKKAAVYYFRGVTTMEATALEDIMELYEVDVEHPNVQLETKLSPDMLHSVILYEIKPYNFHDNTVFIGIRWSALRSPYFLVRNRDYCYLEIQRRFTLPDGRRGFARCLHSVKIKSCPDMEKSHGFVRGSMYRSGLVFIESRRDRRTLDVVQAVYTDLKGNVPKFVTASGLRHRLMNLEHLKKYVSMKRVANQTFARRSQMMAPDKVKTCFVCVDDIGTFQRRYNCQKCGEVRSKMHACWCAYLSLLPASRSLDSRARCVFIYLLPEWTTGHVRPLQGVHNCRDPGRGQDEAHDLQPVLAGDQPHRATRQRQQRRLAR